MATFAVLHSSSDSGSLRNIPSPEHGASQMIRSNMAPSGWKSDAQLFVTIVLGFPHLVIFSARMLALCLTISLAISTEHRGSAEMASVDFPPGAAHRSRTVEGLLIRVLIIWLTNIDDASCT